MNLHDLAADDAPELQSGADGPRLSIEAAQAVLRANERLFANAAVAEIMAGFTDDVVVIFGDLPAMRGKPAVEKFLRARFARQRNYRLKKTLRAVSGDTLAGTWVGEWEDARTGKTMLGRGAECMVMREGKCARWDASFNAWERDGGPQMPIV